MSRYEVGFGYALGETVTVEGVQMKAIGLCHTRDGNMVMLECDGRIIIRTESFLRNMCDARSEEEA